MGRELALVQQSLEEIQSSSNASANETAAAACFILCRDNRAMRSPIWPLGTV